MASIDQSTTSPEQANSAELSAETTEPADTAEHETQPAEPAEHETQPDDLDAEASAEAEPAEPDDLDAEASADIVPDHPVEPDDLDAEPSADIVPDHPVEPADLDAEPSADIVPELPVAAEAGEEQSPPSPWEPGVIDEDPFEQAARPAITSLLFQAPQPVRPLFEPPRREEPVADHAEPPAAKPSPTDQPSSDQPSTEEDRAGQRRRRRGGKGRRSKAAESGAPRAEDADDDTGAADQADSDDTAEQDSGEEAGSRRRTRRRRRSGSSTSEDAAPGVVTKVREPRREGDGVIAVRGSTRLEAKKQRRREGREAGRRRTVITEAEYLARRESVERIMLVRRTDGRTQIAVLEDDVLVEHYVSRDVNTSMAGNIYVGKVQNVLPSMEAAFVDIGKGRNAVLYAGEVNWDAAGLESGQAKRIENALEPGQSVLVQVTKDPIGHKGARLTSQVSLPGRYLVYVPDSAMTGISRKLPDVERARLKKILRDVVPETAGVIVRTAAEGATEAELRADVERLTATWEQIRSSVDALGNSRKGKSGAPAFLHGEPDLTVRVVRDIFNEDFASLVVSGEEAWQEVSDYVQAVAPDLASRLSKWTSEEDLFAHHRVDEQIAKAMDRRVWLPSGGSLVFDRTEAMTVVDVNTGKFVGSGGNLEETVTRNNIEAAEEIVRQLRLRDIGGIIVIDFIDMVLESNRDLVVRRLLECLGRDRTKHQVAEVTSLGLVQMTRKRVGAGLLEVFSETCEHCNGRGYLISSEPIDRAPRPDSDSEGRAGSSGRRGRSAAASPPQPPPGGPTPAQIAAAAHAAAVKSAEEAASAAPDEEPSPAEESGSLDQEFVTPVDAAVTPDVPTPSEEPAQPEGPARREDPTSPEGTATPEDSASPQDQAAREDLPAGQEPSASADSSAAAKFPAQPTVAAAQPPAADDQSPDGSTAPPRRRRHGRVVAPAGPPRGEQ